MDESVSHALAIAPHNVLEELIAPEVIRRKEELIRTPAIGTLLHVANATASSA
ncbi:hypothetical protein [Microbacterium algeriense]|uniref:hypothetical protein n=1 Tax=Microbacterium algeriense TaxID=2615184 RepID=UPI001788AF2F|nr:hypothetical protein [Microbacterium algeriense]